MRQTWSFLNCFDTDRPIGFSYHNNATFKSFTVICQYSISGYENNENGMFSLVQQMLVVQGWHKKILWLQGMIKFYFNLNCSWFCFISFIDSRILETKKKKRPHLYDWLCGKLRQKRYGEMLPNTDCNERIYTIWDWPGLEKAYFEEVYKGKKNFNQIKEKDKANTLRQALLSKSYKKDGAAELKDKINFNMVQTCNRKVITHTFKMPEELYKKYWLHEGLTDREKKVSTKLKCICMWIILHLISMTSSIRIKIWTFYDLSLLWIIKHCLLRKHMLFINVTESY